MQIGFSCLEGGGTVFKQSPENKKLKFPFNFIFKTWKIFQDKYFYFQVLVSEIRPSKHCLWCLISNLALFQTVLFRLFVTYSCRSYGKLCFVVIIKIPVIRIIFSAPLDTFHCLQIAWRRSRSFIFTTCQWLNIPSRTNDNSWFRKFAIVDWAIANGISLGWCV